MNEHDHERVDEVLMDLGLRERLGGERPPDLVDAVRARLHDAPPASPAWHGFLIAAAIVVGAAVVVGVAAWPASTSSPVGAPVAPQGPMQTVDTVEDAAALPVDTREVEVIGGDDHVIEALVRLRSLEVLVVRETWNEAYGLSLKMQAPLRECPVTNAAWRHIASMTKLRRLEFSGTRLVGRVTGEFGGDVVTAVERLPLLESLSLRFLNTPDEALVRLPRLRNLRHLDLSFNHGFTEAGIDAIVQCRSLRSLSLRGCQQLHGTWLAKLKDLPELERLDLSLIDGMNWWSGTGVVDDIDAEVMRKARGWADSLDTGVQDDAIAELAKLPKIRVLEIGSGTWSLAGLHGLAACTTLEELGMFGGRTTGGPEFVAGLPPGLRRLEVCGPYTDAFCSAVREHLPNLRHLCIAACDEITDAGLRGLLAMPSLRVLDMRQMRGLTAGCVDALSAAHQLESLDLRHCPFVTAEHVARLRRELPNLKTLEATLPESQR